MRPRLLTTVVVFLLAVAMATATNGDIDYSHYDDDDDAEMTPHHREIEGLFLLLLSHPCVH